MNSFQGPFDWLQLNPGKYKLIALFEFEGSSLQPLSTGRRRQVQLFLLSDFWQTRCLRNRLGHRPATLKKRKYILQAEVCLYKIAM